MPFYEGLGLVGEKQAVVLELGHALTKVGFAGETTPRAVVDSPGHASNDVDELYELLVPFVDSLFFKHLLVNPKDRRVVLLDDVMSAVHVKQALTRVLFHHFEVASIYYAPQQLTCLLTLGVATALVIDAGHAETAVCPVIEGVPLIKAFRDNTSAGKEIDLNVQRLLRSRGAVVGADNVITKLEEGDAAWTQIETRCQDIKHRLCFVTRMERGRQLQNLDGDASQLSGLSSFLKSISRSVVYPLSPKGVQVPGEVREGAAEALFVPDEDGKSLAHLILDAILDSPIDTRRQLAGNIVFVGGTTMMKGYKARVFEELKDLLQTNDHYGSRLPQLADFLAVHTPPCQANVCSWVGAALMGATDALSAGSYTKETFISEKGLVPDWTNFKFNRITAPQDLTQGKKG